MSKYSNVVEVVAHDSSAMEPRDHLSNGVIPKNQRSRGNFLSIKGAVFKIEKSFLFFIVIGVMLSLVFAGCAKDPEDTITLSVRDCHSGRTQVHPDGCEGGNFIICENNFYGFPNENWQFATVGSVSGLGKIKKIPIGGWSKNVAVKRGYGYVAKFEKGNTTTYVRIYVENYMISADSGGIMGAYIQYQSPFSP